MKTINGTKSCKVVFICEAVLFLRIRNTENASLVLLRSGLNSGELLILKCKSGCKALYKMIIHNDNDTYTNHSDYCCSDYRNITEIHLYIMYMLSLIAQTVGHLFSSPCQSSTASWTWYESSTSSIPMETTD